MFRRSLALLAACAFVLAASVSLAGDTPAAPGTQRFGAPIKVKTAVDIAQLSASPEKFKGRKVRLEGTVKDVCQGKGCWVEVADATGASFMARSLNESVLLPRDCKGMRVVVEGTVMALPMKVAREAEPTDHACPKPSYVVSTKGVELVAAK